MAASDHLNGGQMVKMYHISWDDTPPHELEPRLNSLHMWTPQDNVHPDVLHMGTKRSALQIYRTHLHEYEADPSDIDPIVHGDSQIAMSRTGGGDKYFNKAMAGVQPSLWESVPGNPYQAIRTGKVLPYRNLVEDAGSISYMVPKDLIKSGKVRYVGVTDVEKEMLRKKQ